MRVVRIQFHGDLALESLSLANTTDPQQLLGLLRVWHAVRVHVHLRTSMDVHANLVIGDRLDHRANRVRSASVATDHTPDILRIHADANQFTAGVLMGLD